MYVITDIEWVDESPESKYLTQIAAIRVNESWEAQDSFTRLVSPPQVNNVDWQHVAFRGYALEDFLQADDEAQGLADFHAWLQDGDRLCIWHHEAKQRLQMSWRKHNEGPFGHRITSAHQKVHIRLMGTWEKNRRLYDLAQELGVEMPTPEHCAKNDVYVLHELLQRAFANWEDFKKKATKTETKAERNRRLMEDTSKNFFYLEGSEVFHKRGCPRLLRANAIHSAIYYEYAAVNRRPCKVCNPQSKDGLRDGEALRFVHLFDGTAMWMKNRNIVGKCHYQGHPGIISKGLLEKHNCLGKQCKYLQKYTDSVFWRDLEERQKAAEKAKQNKKAAIARSREEEQQLLDLREEFQYCADCCEERMEIIRVEKEKSCVYRVFYVSDNRFADGNRFPEFLECMQYYRPNWRIILRHIKDVDGHFVTVDEFYARKRA